MGLYHPFGGCQATLLSDISSDIYQCQVRTNLEVRLKVIQQYHTQLGVGLGGVPLIR